MYVKTVGIALLVFFGIVPFAVATPCITPKLPEFHSGAPLDAETYVKLGKWYGDRKAYACAIEAFRAGLVLEPSSAEISYLLGLTLYETGDATAAIAPLRQSIQAKPDVIKPHLVLASAFVELRSKDNAKTEYEAALHLDPRSVAALEGLSALFLTEGNYRAVISLLHTAPLDENLTLNLAQAYGREHMLDQAAQILTPALRTNPSSLRLTNALATVYVNQTRYQEAVSLAEKSVQRHPGDLETQELYLHLLVLNHDLNPARALASKLMASHAHDFEVLYLSGVVEREQGQYDTARQHLQEAIALNATHFNVRYNLGIVLLALNDPAGAKVQLEKAIALGAGPTEPQVRYQLSMALRRLGEDKEAEKQSNLTEKEMQSVEDSTLAVGKSEEAEAALKAGDTQKAVGLYREAVDATPNNALLNFKLAMALDGTGDTETERAALEKAVTIDPTFALAHNQIGYLASRNGDLASAEEHFRLAIKAAPGYAEAWLSLAATLGMESRVPEALDAVTNAIRLDRKNDQALQLRQALRNAQKQH